MTNIKQALEDLKQGKLIVVLDDLDRENEGDLLGIAQYMTADSINFMITHGKGLLCAPISQEVAAKHNLQLAPKGKSDGTNFMLSIDGPRATTGISAQERMDTFEDLLSEEPVEFMTPGHLFPLLARNGGLSVRRGHTEAGVDLAKLTGAKEVSAIIEIIREDGTMMRGPELIEFSKQHNLTFITIEDLVQYIKENNPEIWELPESENLFTFSDKAKLPTKNGLLNIMVAKDQLTGEDYSILWNGDIDKMNNPLVRVHSKCLTSEVFGSLKCDCKEQLDLSLERISKEQGIIIYTPDEGRGVGMFNKINAYSKQDEGLDTVEANKAIGVSNDLRDFKKPGYILKQLNIKEVTLMSNNPLKIKGLEDVGIKVSRQEHWTNASDEAKNYIQTKINKMGHIK